MLIIIHSTLLLVVLWKSRARNFIYLFVFISCTLKNYAQHCNPADYSPCMRYESRKNGPIYSHFYTGSSATPHTDSDFSGYKSKEGMEKLNYVVGQYCSSWGVTWITVSGVARSQGLGQNSLVLHLGAHCNMETCIRQY